MQARKLIAAATLGLGAAVTSIAYAADDGKPKQSVGEYTSDAVVTTKVKSEIVGSPALSALDIAVETNNGVVTLTGSVASAAQSDEATRVTRGVKGVTQVKNNLKVDPSKAHK
ncbi:BON domain-containing protein [Achromobacter aloeverae]|uniref:Phospholipid-binding protein n=1 Tax=Achromobacter aloeverae TaxID=1750518 RepID=A0A4Q1HDT7_9BURK|nr:BON domain-containing protein [Achromobacter aloeverae]RXN83944.1 phospholipid-binding protein [Achromobacter aloeverae]